MILERKSSVKASNQQKENPLLRIIPLGGLSEVGKNMLVIELNEEMLVIDCGQMFPEEDMLGIDMVLPDFSYVRENQDKLKGIILTHGHEDHAGALPYLLKDIRAPVYGTKLTLGLIEPKLDEHKVKKPKLQEITAGTKRKIGSFLIDFIPVAHSIPAGVALAIETKVGIIVHSGDFKIDQTPIDGRLTDVSAFAKYAERTLVLLSDSTNAENSGYTLSEKTVGSVLEEIFAAAKGRIIVACFASHIHRIQQIMDAAVRQRRKVAVCGRSMLRNIEISGKLNYLHLPKRALVDLTKIDKLKDDQVLILTTGSQGEPLSALTRMATGNHKHVDIRPGDTVVVSAKPVPGNEKSVTRVIDLLFRKGADVYYKSISEVHVSGHAAQEELKMLINLIKPTFFVPIHGEFRHLKYHAQLARSLGISDKNIFVMENGQVLEISNNQARLNGKVHAAATFVDGLGVGDIGSIVLRDRQVLAQDGICVVIVAIDVQEGKIVSGPDIISRGFVYAPESSKLFKEAKSIVNKALTPEVERHVSDWSILRGVIRSSLRSFFYERIKRRPMILPVIVEL